MQIEDADKFKVWLTATLEPLCDADPGDLSKYVLALIKKKRTSDQMKENLDVFLQSKTAGFVDKLFSALESKEYLEFKPPSPVKETKPVEGAEPSADAAPAHAVKDENEAPPADNSTADKSESSAKHDVDTRRDSGGGGGGGRRHMSPRRRSPPRHRRDHRSRGGSPPPRRFRSRSPYDRRRSPPGGYRGRRGRSPPSYDRRRSRSRSYSPQARRPAASRLDPPLESSSSYVPTGRQRCRDYDEKGYCMQGDQCKYDHGTDAVVIEDSTGVPAYNPSDPAIGGAKPDLSVPPPGYSEPYIPGVTAVSTFSVPPPGYPPSAVGGEGSRKRSHFEDGVGGPPRKIRGGMMGRGRGSGRGGGHGHGAPPAFAPSKGCTQLAVRNIPPTLNNIGLMNNHFGRFGTLVNVQVHFEGDPASALISFSTPMEAESAMNSSEAVLANRFIRVFYHQDKPKVHQRLGPAATATAKNGEADKTLESETSPDVQKQKEQERAAAIAAIKKNQEVLQAKAQMKKNAESRKLEALNKIKELSRSKQELLEKQMAEQKNLISKIEEKKGAMRPEERSAIMSLIKTLADSISKTKEDLQKLVQTSNRRSASDLQKELLDAELELFNAQQEGSENVAEIQKKVNALSIEAAKLGLLPTSRSPGARGGAVGHRGGRGFYTPRGRGFYSPRGYRGARGGRGGGPPGAFATSVDRRPSKLKVGGFDSDDKEAVISHFKRFGEVLDTVELDETVIIHFKTRREAEMAMSGGKTFGEQPLQLSWFTGTIPGELQSQVSSGDGPGDVSVQSDGTAGSVHDVSDVGADLEDDYTPLDPAYLPPGLGDDGGAQDDDGKNGSKDLDESNADDILNDGDDDGEDEINEDLLNEEEDEDEDDDDEGRSWKRGHKE